MRSDDVIVVLDLLAGAGVRAWVDGGWGVDALLGETCREHSDLDLVVVGVSVARSVLVGAGFARVLRDWLPTALALGDGEGREVDLHPVVPTSDGGGDQLLPSGSFHYPAPVVGVIGGRVVECVDPVTQVACHVGYSPGEKDFVDVRRLAGRFGISLPESYRG
jgi:lincosamide nucleotidyltransferase A/C/D/E